MEYRGNVRDTQQADKGRYRDLPLCSIVLIGLNVIVFLIGLLLPQVGELMEAKGCFGIAYLLYQKEFYRLVTAAFLHADVEHLLNNMLLLYFCGEIVEKSLGKGKFLILYFLSAISGNLLSAAYEVLTGSFYDSIGASGAVFGLTGALLFLVAVHKGTAATMSLKRVLLAVLLSLYAGFSSAYVNNAAHVGGLLSGFLLAFLLSMIPPFPKRSARMQI